MFRALKYRLGVSEKLIGPNFESKFTTSFRSGSVFFSLFTGPFVWDLPKNLGTCSQKVSQIKIFAYEILIELSDELKYFWAETV